LLFEVSMRLPILDPRFAAVVTLDDKEQAALAEFVRQEAAALGLGDDTAQWRDPLPQEFRADQREHTTIWVSGLTWSHDLLIAAALRGLGYRVRPLPVPDTESLRYGKEFGNRGQCNPTYFTVGNLIKHLKTMERNGLPKAEIVEQHVFLTAGACGPCRFGTYVTEYRKALRDAGFDGFRVLLFQQQGGLRQATGTETGLRFDLSFFRALVCAFLAGDVLNLMGYRLRPYEVTPGATDAAIARCREILIGVFEQRRSVLRALRRCRAELAGVETDRLRAKPLVAVIGEFWAMTTEGEGNYELQRFLEAEGAEVAIQPIMNWILFILWEQTRDTRVRMGLRGADGGRKGLDGTRPLKKLLLLRAARVGLVAVFRTFARAIGLRGYHLPDMDHIARIAHAHYDNALRGGEGHMEVGKLIDCVADRRAHMVVSVKPFGCMPSSGVSDGVQSLITARYPDAVFLPIETTGDGKVNVQSRVQMVLFRAHQRAQREFDEALASAGGSREEKLARLRRHPAARNGLHHPPHRAAGTAANLVLELTR
jgi:predicted nucleotide-binding protein (sugar kinase/HSP70/actin superfamily)